MPASPSPRRRIELFVRSLSPTVVGPDERVLDDLRALGDTEAVSEYHVTVWGSEVGLSTTASRTDQGRFLLDRVAEFKTWALTTNVDMERFFETRNVNRSLTGEQFSALVLPRRCLAEYVDDELVRVTPHVDDGALVTVADHLGTLLDNANDEFVGNASTEREVVDASVPATSDVTGSSTVDRRATAEGDSADAAGSDDGAPDDPRFARL